MQTNITSAQKAINRHNKKVKALFLKTMNTDVLVNLVQHKQSDCVAMAELMLQDVHLQADTEINRRRQVEKDAWQCNYIPEESLEYLKD